MLKKLTIILFFLLFAFTASSQTMVHVDKMGQSYDWKLSNQACNGCGSFYMRVDRSVYPDQRGLYYFYVYFWSNSFYANGYTANTYITELNFYFIQNGTYFFAYNLPYLLVSPSDVKQLSDKNLGAVLYGADNGQIIKLTWKQAIAY